MIGKFVLVRTYSAGVHCGWLEQQADKAALLRECRRVWRWTEAFSLNEISLRGCGEASRISDPSVRTLLTEVIEVIECTEEAKKNLMRSRNGQSKSST